MLNRVFWNTLSDTEKLQVLQRATATQTTMYADTVNIIEQVKTGGDAALKILTQKFDKVVLDQIKVSDQEFTQAYQNINKTDLNVIQTAIQRIKAYHQAQLPENWIYNVQEGIECERQARPISAVGLYVPGGTAPLISTVMMLAIPASVAGCAQRIICTPPNAEGKIADAILVTARECGIQNIYKVGGAQAIAAMAYGTQTVPKVDKIFGPGNQWVTLAKQICTQSANISIDIPAGPSELLVIADEYAIPEFVAADLLSQAEHDVLSQVFLVTTSENFANQVFVKIQEQISVLPRRTIAEKALEKSNIIIVKEVAEAIQISNTYAPEHLSLQVQNPEQYKSQIVNAGTVFIGPWTAETLGDYMIGSNHVLPTSGYTRSISGLSIYDFIKWIGFQKVNQKGFMKIGPFAEHIATMETMGAHGNAVRIRLDNMNEMKNA